MSLTDSIIGAESGGNPNAQNPNSSASGPGQFIDSTFLDVARKMRPELADQPDSSVLALKTDPQFARQATDYYAQQNQAILQKNGVPVTDGTTYLAHFAGPGGAVKVLQADPNAPVSDILGPAVVKANPFLAGMTAQGLHAWAAKKMGASLPQPGVQSAPSASPPSAPLNIAPQPPIFAQQPQAQPEQQAAPSAPFDPATFAAPVQPQPIFASPRKPINLAALRAAFPAPSFYRG